MNEPPSHQETVPAQIMIMRHCGVKKLITQAIDFYIYAALNNWKSISPLHLRI